MKVLVKLKCPTSGVCLVTTQKNYIALFAKYGVRRPSSLLFDIKNCIQKPYKQIEAASEFKGVMTRCRDLHYLHSVVDIGGTDVYGQLRTAVESKKKKHSEELKQNFYVRLVLCGNQAILNAHCPFLAS